MTQWALRAHCFHRLQLNLLARRKEREQAYKAEAFMKYKVYLKYFYSILHFTTLRLEKH